MKNAKVGDEIKLSDYEKHTPKTKEDFKVGDVLAFDGESGKNEYTSTGQELFDKSAAVRGRGIENDSISESQSERNGGGSGTGGRVNNGKYEQEVGTVSNAEKSVLRSLNENAEKDVTNRFENYGKKTDIPQPETERKNTGKELTVKGYKEEVVNGNHKYTLQDTENNHLSVTF